jgi:DNA-binding transcriptional MerR regulator
LRVTLRQLGGHDVIRVLTPRYVYVNVILSGKDHPNPHLTHVQNQRAWDRQMTETMTIREMCNSFGVTPRTLRFYEQKELLFPIREGMRRLFTGRNRARLTLILRGKRFGFSLEDIRQLLDMYDRDGRQEAQLSRTYEIARDRLTVMERQRADLDEAIADLKDQLAWAEQVLATFRRDAAA